MDSDIIWDNQIKWKNGYAQGEIICVGTWNVWNCVDKKWKSDPPVILRNAMLLAAHPNRRYAIAEVSTTATNPALLNPFKAGNITLQLDLASGSRTHGRFTFDDSPIGQDYYGKGSDDQWKRIQKC